MTSFNVTGLTTASQTLTTGESGLITTNGTLATDGNAIEVSGGVVVSVYGVIHAIDGAAIDAFTDSVLDLNVGSGGAIYAANTGVGGRATVYTGGASALFVHNAGVIQSDWFAAIYANSAANTEIDINNSGVLQGDTGILVNGSDTESTILNTGTIMGQSYGIHFLSTGTNATVDFYNSGTLISAGTAYAGSNGTDRVANNGVINGTVALGAGDDIFDNRGGTVTGEVFGATGDDTYIIDDAGLVLVENAGEGTDEVQSTVSYNLGDNFENLTLLGTDDLHGRGNGADNTLTGNAGDNVLAGLDGDDTINGEAGFDTLRGGDGNDSLRGGIFEDYLTGENGEDTVVGGNGNDTLLGGGDNDRLFGQQGDDALQGGDQNDHLNGGTGNDVLSGGGGFDTLIGSVGDDVLTGNFNADRFIFADGDGSDTITDFDATNNAEKIDLSGVSSIINFADLSGGHMTQVGAHVVIDAGGGDVITLLNVNIADLDAIDFVF